ncbi:beta-hexosaminidase precursor [Flavobacterium cauense R2A-7]|uniref:beta-N-acetylhexosaminidase n=1 Tax=Flavobacterium cauense R2A-7 TaxID=1341154 RepID=V6S5B0_9FLAO|nr:family 20 glycosylhydrolase [Flavobacterium cauense]ESU21614.1 beta-hexosaminidase precursor [Flavobacterium cauense R2A-7]KGO80141.1 beta-N-acetylhexosaminidase [Flavobacterium cauense R2A-7]TWI10450.1 hexosaminidase [Flavobacterium cauense R2A-7]
MPRLFVLFLFLIATVGFAQNQLPLIPQPKSLIQKEGSFTLNQGTLILIGNSESNNEIRLFNEFLKTNYGFELITTTNSKSPLNTLQILVENPNDVKNGAYELNVSTTQIRINAKSNLGLFYAFQTLQQLLPVTNKEELKIQTLEIKDEPKYAWRGMHLDVCRHFFPIDFIKKYIDYLAMYKMNTFHWHLTDDQGWRIEIKKYPKLTEVGAWRKGSMVGHYNDQQFDNKKYGGFYTQEEIKEIVAYAKARHITVVPEIEMPGHAVAALASYPELSCTGGPFDVAMQWGVLDDVLCPKESTFQFLEAVLSEVIALFPSEYIHIGGDESPKVRWKNCAHCQALIKKEGLKDEHELQSYFIKRIEKFVNGKGRQIIGWDEILEGGLAPNAAVMSWRGTEGGINAAKQKHFVVMTPGSHCYFDHYQGEPKNEPVAIGGYTTVEKVYSLEPTPKELTSEEAKYILGAQGNVWTEYINTPEHVEYMIMPRMAALAEVVWGTSDASKYQNFQNRLIQHFSVYDTKGINYSRALFEVTSKVSPSEKGKGVDFALKSANPGICFTTDGTNPTANSKKYTESILVTKNQTIKAAYFENGKQKSAVIEQPFFISKSTGKKISLVNQPHENYGIGGSFTLVDGMRGNMEKYGRDWIGFWGKDLNATIDLGKKQCVSKVTVDVLTNDGSWIHYPKYIEVLVSKDGKTFQSIKKITAEEIRKMKGIVTIEFDKQKTKYIKVIAPNAGKIPEGKPGAGSDCWLFVDEIMVE